jgi:thiopeptide-type bacteriocin biosynthesis protein
MGSPREVGIRAGDGIVVRTPLLPMTAFVEWATAPDPRAYLAAVLELPEVREALYVASPSLYAAIDSWKAAPTSANGARVEHSLVKYVSRMMGRSTPFGLFSAVSAGKLGRETKLELAPRSEYRRRTRLDNDYLFVLVGELVKLPEVRDRLTFRPNNSLYRSAGRLRYAGAQLVDKDRSYHLISVEPTPYLEATLERVKDGATRDQLAQPLVDDDITIDDARAYVDELIEAQLIVPDLGIFVTGPEPIDGLLGQLEAAGLTTAHAILSDARAKIEAIDRGGVGNSPERYREIAATLEPLPAKVDLARLFQVDMVKPANMTIGNRVAAELAQVIGQLGKFSRGRGSFDDFKRAFMERWEGRAVPLSEVLDEESGIGFEAARGPGTEGAPLLAGLPFAGGQAENRVTWSRVEQHLLKRLAQALASGATEIVLEDADLEAMKGPVAAVLPDAFATTIRLAGTAAEPVILSQGSFGPSGARLLGRFCHASTEIDAMVRAHHIAEEALRSDAVFAEIVHLNEGRIGNILCRPVLRDYEIVYLGVSGAPLERQIPVEDLLVTMRGDRIVLLSKRLGREVIPRLTTAHNYRLRSLGIYRFLCALANQDCDTVGFSWGPLGNAPYLPRVRVGKVIVERESWTLDKADIDPITAAVRATNKAAEKKQPLAGPSVAEVVAALRTRRNLPRMFVISAGDNELPIDLDNPLLAAAFADELSGLTGVKLVEMFPPVDQLLATGPEGAFANEIVLMFTKPAEKGATRQAAQLPRVAQVQREYPPGSEWLYAKIYCGESTTDRVLREAIAPVVREVIASGDAEKWFFIRYHDPDPHVRVRFAGDPARLLAKVMPALERAVAPLTAGGAVRKLVLDTYAREVERYGGDRGIELVEDIFWHDSDAVLGIIELIDGDAGGIARWKLALRGIDSTLDALGLTAEQRAKISGDAKEMLGREMRAETYLWTKIGERFTRERADLDLLLARDAARDAGHDLEPGFELLATRDALIKPIGDELRARDAAGALSPGLEAMGWSIVHMHANRILHASQRAQELVLYDFLRRLHASNKARAKK